MTVTSRGRVAWLGVAILVGAACRLRPPDLEPPRMIEPDVHQTRVTPAGAAGTAGSGATFDLRLTDTHARGHIGRRLLHRAPGGELLEDEIWRWSSAPDRYLDSTLRLAFADQPSLRLVDAAGVPAISVTLVEWYLDPAVGGQLVGAVELQLDDNRRGVRTELIRGQEALTAGDMPGDLSAAAGRLLWRLALESIGRARTLVEQ